MTVIDPWTPGVRLLCNQGIPERHARSFIGKLVTQHGRAKVLKAVLACEKEPPACAQEYLVGVLNGGDGPRKWSDEWVDRELKAGRIQARPGETYTELRRRLRGERDAC